jgi:hypothetical protein
MGLAVFVDDLDRAELVCGSLPMIPDTFTPSPGTDVSQQGGHRNFEQNRPLSASPRTASGESAS